MTSKTFYQYSPVLFSGLTDGIIVPLSVYAFFIRSLGLQNQAMLITAIAGAGFAITLGIGAYFTRKTEIQTADESTLIKIYSNLGIDENTKLQMMHDVEYENQNWHQEWDAPGNVTLSLSPFLYAILISLACITGAMIVLASAYFTLPNTLQFVIAPLFLLMLAGYTKCKIAGQNPLTGILTIVLSASLAVLGNWLVASLFLQ